MTGPTRSKSDHRAAELSHRDRLFWDERAKEQQERTAKTMRLRALRLAKEAAEQETAKAQASVPPVPTVKGAGQVGRRASAKQRTATPAPDGASGR